MAEASDFLIGMLAQGLEANANKPVKTSTFTTGTTTPYAREDMIQRRDSIGAARQNLSDMLKRREDYGYSLANALATMPQQQGAGTWLGDFARGFGSTFNAPTNAAIDRAQKEYETEMQDLAQILAYDKAMGDTQTQTQTIGYTPMEDTTGSKGQIAGGKSSAQKVPVIDAREWEYMINNFDKDRPNEAAFRNMSEKDRDIHNWRVGLGWGDKDEMPARERFNQILAKDFLPIARDTLKGTGPITDFEDKKYTKWLNNIKDPVQLKDVYALIINDVAEKNRWSKEQRAEGLFLLGLQSESGALPKSVEEAFPERVKKTESANDGWKTTASGIKYRIKPK